MAAQTFRASPEITFNNGLTSPDKLSCNMLETIINKGFDVFIMIRKIQVTIVFLSSEKIIIPVMWNQLTRAMANGTFGS